MICCSMVVARLGLIISICFLAGCTSVSSWTNGFDDVELNLQEQAAIKSLLSVHRSERLVTIKASTEWRTVQFVDRWIDESGLHCYTTIICDGGSLPISYEAADPHSILAYRWLRQALAKTSDDLEHGRPQRIMRWHLIPDKSFCVATNRRAHIGQVAWIAKQANTSVKSENVDPWEAEHSWNELLEERPSDVFMLTLLLDVFDGYLARRSSTRAN